MIRGNNFQTVEKIGNSSVEYSGTEIQNEFGKLVVLLYLGKGKCLDFISCRRCSISPSKAIHLKSVNAFLSERAFNI